ncbi:hypothetical protein H6P81_017962 [Aristolochia fimbriata]|uniref:Uncharacterized protein n=1 Tax=Aristolochia fimbriata TaxID=158543 RepID=A0AAV7E0F5_ARIFI|nr:hypothetical protein H6P81_017962 [Aristolochia fimbriata]
MDIRSRRWDEKWVVRLWGKLAEDFADDLDKKYAPPVTVIVTSTIVKEFQGNPNPSWNTREIEDDKSVVRKSEPILGELANAIDERLYYYEQVTELCAEETESSTGGYGKCISHDIIFLQSLHVFASTKGSIMLLDNQNSR